MLPAVLLLLSEEPSHGYELVKALRAFRFGDVDRPAVYRALGQLEKDGLVESWSAESKAGQARRVYDLTADGRHALRAWMGILKEERDGLDRVLRRYRATGTADALLAEAEATLGLVVGVADPVPTSSADLERTFGVMPGAAFPRRRDGRRRVRASSWCRSGQRC